MAGAVVTFPHAIQTDRGEPSKVRVGIVRQAFPLIVTLQETPLENVGILEPYYPVEGDNVALLGQSAVGTSGSSWLVLGAISSLAEPPPNPSPQITVCRVDVNTTAVATFSDILCGGVPLSIPYTDTFTKFRDGTDLEVDFRAMAFVTGATASVQFGVSIDGVDHDTTYFAFNVTGQHLHMSSIHLIAGVPAGDLTINARWRRDSGAGTLNANGDDMFSVAVREVT